MNEIKRKEEMLYKYKFGLQQELGKEFFEFATDEIRDKLMEHTILTLRAAVWSDNFKHYEIKYPKDWKEAIKERWCPKWLLRKWPVNYKKIIIDVNVLYPGYKPLLKNEKYYFHLGEEDILYYET